LTAVVWRVQTDGVVVPVTLFRVSKEIDLVVGVTATFSDISKRTLPTGASVSVSAEILMSAMICKNKW